MSFTLSSLDVHFLVKELRPLIIDSFVDKFYQGEDRSQFLIRMRSPTHGKQQLFAKVPQALFLTNHRYSWPQNPPGFCMQLRKQLSNAKLVAIHQHDFERIIIVDFVKGVAKWQLVIELFSKGNVCLLNAEGLIRGVMSLQRWSGRTLRVNESYAFPPCVTNTPSLSVDQLKVLFDQEKRELVKFCATSLSLGGKYAEELVASSGLDKSLVSLSDEQFSSLHASLHALFSRGVSAQLNDGDAAPFPLLAWGDSSDSFDSFSEAVESLVVSEKIAVIDDEMDSVHSSHASKYQRIIDQQSNKLKGYELAGLENQRKGESIYEHYQELNVLLSSLNQAHKKGGWPAVKGLIKEKSWPISVNEATGLISITFEE